MAQWARWRSLRVRLLRDAGPTLTRWEVSDDGPLRPDASVNFSRLGLTRGTRFGAAPIASDTLAYLLDAAQLRGHLESFGHDRRHEHRSRSGSAGCPARLAAHHGPGRSGAVTAVWEQDYRFASSSSIVTVDGRAQRVIAHDDEPRCEQLA